MSYYRRDRTKIYVNRQKNSDDYMRPKQSKGDRADRGHINSMIYRKHKKFLDPTQADDLERRWLLGSARGGRKKNPKPISLAGPKFTDNGEDQ